MKIIKEDNLGTPDISFAGLKIWINKRQFPDADDYWDGNWLYVTAFCDSFGSQVWTEGPIIHLSEIEHLLKGMENLYHTLQGEAELPCAEPNLSVKVSLDRLGNGTLTVQITPDHMTENHEYIFEVDQSYFPKVISELKTILEIYPIKTNNKT